MHNIYVYVPAFFFFFFFFFKRIPGCHMCHWKLQQVTRAGRASEAVVLWVGRSSKNYGVGQDLYLEGEITFQHHRRVSTPRLRVKVAAAFQLECSSTVRKQICSSRLSPKMRVNGRSQTRVA